MITQWWEACVPSVLAEKYKGGANATDHVPVFSGNFVQYTNLRSTLATGVYKPRDITPDGVDFLKFDSPSTQGDFHVVEGFLLLQVVQRSARSLQHAAAVATSEPH